MKSFASFQGRRLVSGLGERWPRTKRRPPRPSRPLTIELLEARNLLAGTWTLIPTPMPESITPAEFDTMYLLSNGQVLAHQSLVYNSQVYNNDLCYPYDPEYPSQSWWLLSPDATGSYANGSFTPAASMNFGRYFFDGTLLQDGRVLVFGGEANYSPDLCHKYDNRPPLSYWSEVYDPTLGSWTTVAAGDARQDCNEYGCDLAGALPTEILPNGKVLVGNDDAGNGGPPPHPEGAHLFDPSQMRPWYLDTSSNNRGSGAEEEDSWVWIRDRRNDANVPAILSVDTLAVCNNGNNAPQTAQIADYNGVSVTWAPTADAPDNLTDQDTGGCPQAEIGPAVRLAAQPSHSIWDGRALFIGAQGNTGLYDESMTNWSRGPTAFGDLRPLWAADAPAAVMPNGHVLAAFNQMEDKTIGGLILQEFVPGTGMDQFVNVTGGPVGLTVVTKHVRMLVLPTGQVLVSQPETPNLYLYTPDGCTPDPDVVCTPADPSWNPGIISINPTGNTTFRLTGMQLTGVDEGAAYGDDAPAATNYPLVRLEASNGSKYYARTFNWSTSEVAATGPMTTMFDVTGIPAGTYTLFVIADGIVSDPYPRFVVSPGTAGGSDIGNALRQVIAASSSPEIVTAPRDSIVASRPQEEKTTEISGASLQQKAAETSRARSTPEWGTGTLDQALVASTIGAELSAASDDAASWTAAPSGSWLRLLADVIANDNRLW